MILNKSALIYHKNLQSNEKALKYLKSRNISNYTIKKFLLGYCEKNIASDKLLQYYKKEELESSGIFSIKDQKVYDRFNNRITIPIICNKEVKYITSRAIRHSSMPHLHQHGKIELAINHNILYKSNTIIIVEGPFDCFALDQIGIPVIGLLGANRITRTILENLYRKNIYICFDNDSNESGQKASYRLAKKIASYGIKSKIIKLPRENEKKIDIDIYLKNHNKQDFIDLMEKAELYNKVSKKSKFTKQNNNFDIVAIISKYIKIEPSVDRFKAICPFHEDTKASMVIYPKTNTSFCFGCNKYLNALSFIVEIEKKRGNIINYEEANNIARAI